MNSVFSEGGNEDRVPSEGPAPYNEGMVQFSYFTLGGFCAYIDPLSGTIIVQMIISGLVGAFAYFIRPIWQFFRIPGRREAAGLLIVRLVFGLGIMLHGWHKVQGQGGAFGWLGPDAHVPAFFQGLATLAELGGGLGIILGLLTPLVAFGLICNMLVALFIVHFPNGDPFVGSDGHSSFEPAAHYLAVAILLLFTGPGAWSLDAVLVPAIFHRRNATDRQVPKP